MTGLAALALFCQLDATLFFGAAVVVLGIGLWRNGRPKTRKRLMDACLASSLLVMVGLRYATLAALALVAPDALFGEATPPLASGTAAALYAVVAVLGLASYRGSVVWRVTGALVFALATIGEGIANVMLIEASVLMRLDTLLSFLIAAVALVFAAFHWAHRTATPNPLGSDPRPFDY